MKTVKTPKILIIHAWGIGDLVMFTPALKVLRQKFPSSVIDILITYHPVVAEVLEEGRTVNRIFKFFWRKKGLLDKVKLILRLRREKYDWIVVTAWTNQWKGGVLASLIGAKVKVGSYGVLKTPLYTHNVPRKENRAQLEQNLDLLRALEVKVGKTPWPFFEFGKEAEAFSKKRMKQIRGKVVIGFHPGAELVHQYLYWPKESFIQLGQKMVGKKVRFLVFGGPDEKKLCQDIEKGIGKRAFLAVNLPLKQVAALIDKCNLFISSDSGLGHMAGTTNTNLISIFGPSNPKRSAPRGPKVKVISEKCRHRYDENREHTCLKRITPDIVFKEIGKILKKEKRQIG